LIPKECKRLAEVDFPIAVVSKCAAGEKEARCGHIPKIHNWPAARPTNSCRAVLLALLLPDPCDVHCPEDFKIKVRELLPKVQGNLGPKDEDLRQSILKFIGDFSNWDLSSNQTYLEVGRGLVKAAHPEETTLVVDPFAGGGSIPLEALRLGCETFASDLNPVACLILKVMLEDIPQYGAGLADELKRVGREIKEAAEKELAEFYSSDPDGSVPIAYLWARTVHCESPNCGAEIPLVRSFWLCKKASRKKALKYKIINLKQNSPHVEFDIFEPRNENEVPAETVSRAKATCLCCGTVLSPERVRAQLAGQRGGADVIFDGKGSRIGGARLLAVVTLNYGEQGRHYRLPTGSDYEAVWKAVKRLEEITAKPLQNRLSNVPDEPLPPIGTLGFRVQRYGMRQWGDLFTVRQKVALVTFVRLLRALGESIPVMDLLTLCFSKLVDMNNNLATWQPPAEIPAHMLTRFAIPMKWDFTEAVPTSDSSGTLDSSIKRSTEPFPNLVVVTTHGTALQADATSSPLPDQCGHVWFTDPPYYDAVPYADISDFFFVWMKRVLPNHPLLRDKFDPGNPLTPKIQEIVQDEVKIVNGHPKNRAFFEEMMARSFSEGRRILREDGVGSVVFAHKTTEGWEAFLTGLIKGGWTITGSWPITTESRLRLRARDSAALATSVHLVCRPRSEDAPVGDWGNVLRELPKRVGDWMERLQSEGIRGADLVFACIGPALEIFSRYSKVVDAEEREIPLGGDPEALEPHRRGFLSYVWEVVGRTALEQVLGTPEAKARNSTAGALEEDVRLTALFLWTLQSTNGNGSRGEKEIDEDEEEDEEEETPKKKKQGYSLIFDVVRRFAQPLGIHLPEWEGRIIETEKGVVRLLSVKDRAKQLFGEESAQAFAERFERSSEVSLQLKLFPEGERGSAPEIKGHKGRKKKAMGAVSDEALRAKQEATTLDRIHAAMLLQANGRTNALRALIKSEQDRGPDFLRLANALSALYPKQSEEKRLLDAMLLAMPRT